MDGDRQSQRRRSRLALPRPLPLHPVLLAAYSVLFLWSENLDEATLTDVAPPLVQVVAAALAVLGLLTLVLRNRLGAAVIASAVLAGFLAFGHVDRILAPLRVTHAVQFAGWLILIAAAVALALRRRASLPRITSALNIMAFALVAVALASIIPHELSRAGRGDANTAVVSPTAAPPGEGVRTQRDIYYLVFDRYGSESSILRNQGLDNDLPEWLTEHGFFVAADSHANYARTALSLASTLNLKYLDELTNTYGRNTDDVTPTYRMIRNNAVVPFLKSVGYRYVHLGSWFEPTRTSPLADVNLNVRDDSEFASVFVETTVLPAITEMLGQKVSHRERHRTAALYQLEKLREIPALPGPKFVFAHVLLPHHPYVFRADGGIVTEEEARAMPESRRFEEQLKFTNDRIREILAPLLELPEPSRPIIVLQADEGPYVQGRGRPEVDWVNIRYGILNAFYLPDGAAAGPGSEPYAAISSVNTFRMLFNRYFGARVPLLPDRSYCARSRTSGRAERCRREASANHTRKEGLYDFVDVTHLLARR